MLDTNLMGEFELIEVSVGNHTNKSNICKIDGNKKCFTIPRRISEQLCWADKERVNLYRFGETFLLKPDNVGLLTMHNYKGVLAITSKNFCIELLSRTRSCREYEAWVEGNALLFKPKKGEE